MIPTRKGQRRAAHLVVAAYVLTALTSLGLVFFGSAAQRREPWIELVFDVLGLPAAPSLLVAALCAVLAGALSERKRLAWWAALVPPLLTAGAAVLGLTDDPLPGEAMFFSLSLLGSALTLLVLVRARREFTARLDRGAGWAAAATLLGGALAMVGVLAALILTTPLGNRGSFTQTLAAGLAWTLGVRDVQSFPRRWVAVPVIVGLMGAASVVAAVAVFFRGGRPTVCWSPGAELRLRGLLQREPNPDSLAYFATRRDKQLYFSPDGRAAVAAAPFFGVLLASGDPVGARDSWDGAVAEFIAQARERGCTPAAIAVSEAGARAYVGQGLSALPLGDEAVLDAAQFSLNQPALAEVRAAVRRAQRAGVTVEICPQRELDPDELRRLLATAAGWRHGDERGYSMELGRFGDPADGGNLLVVARQAGELVGLLQLVPWGRQGFSLDLMRRSRTAPNGTVELMVAQLMQRSRTMGVRRVSLNFAVLRHTFVAAERVGATPWTRLNSSLLRFLDRFFQIESLYRSNQKYAPQWVPRLICFEGSAALPRVLTAMGRAEGYLGHRRLRDVASSPELAAAAEELATAAPQLPPGPAHDIHRLRAERALHARQLHEAGQDLHPLDVGQPLAVAALTEQDWREQPEVTVAGRVWRKRDHGGVLFVDLRDGACALQVVLESGVPGAAAARALDRGDIVTVSGRLGTSRTGTPSLLATSWRLASKSVATLPEERVADPEARLRDRTADLLLHPPALELLRQRSTIVRTVRDVLGERGFREVETPQLTAVHGGATARPFRTMSNAYGLELCLRIAPELALKQLVVAGMGPIFEIGRNFRNEGADATHNPEFTSLEAYQPWADYTTMRLLTEELVCRAATAVHGRPALPLRQGDGTFALTEVPRPWRVVSVEQAVSQAVGEPVSVSMSIDRLTEIAAAHGIRARGRQGPGYLVEELYGELVEPVTIEPTFFVDFPAETSPLTAPHRAIKGLAERWDLVCNGMEVGTAYSELTDPELQRQVLTAQSLAAAAGDPEAMEVDETFLRALELGMPPTGGLGIGVDRLVMLLTGVTIRDALAFPFVRPRA